MTVIRTRLSRLIMGWRGRAIADYAIRDKYLVRSHAFQRFSERARSFLMAACELDVLRGDQKEARDCRPMTSDLCQLVSDLCQPVLQL